MRNPVIIVPYPVNCPNNNCGDLPGWDWLWLVLSIGGAVAIIGIIVFFMTRW